MPKRQKVWVYRPPRPRKVQPSESIKAEVEARANELVETFLKPQSIKPPPEDMRFNYIVDIFTKWYRSYFYFYTRYPVQVRMPYHHISTQSLLALKMLGMVTLTFRT